MSQMPPPPPPPASGPGPFDQPTVARPAELLDRFAARLIDWLILGLVYVLVYIVVIVGLVIGSTTGLIGNGSYLGSLLSSIVVAALFLGYSAYMESSQGRTIGKMVLRLRVVGPDGATPSLEEAGRRNIFMAFGLLGIIPVIGGFLSFVAWLVGVIMIAVGISNDAVNRQGWHDTFAGGTRVIKEG